MRISTIQIYSKSVNEMLNKQASVSDVQLHIASGKKIFTPSDDPVGASKAMLLKKELNTSEIYQKNCTYAKNYLEQQESILTSGINILQRISELTIQAGSGTLSDTDRFAIIEEINVRKNELLDLSNYRDSNGDYFFSGFKSNSPTVKMDNSGNYVYQGDDGLRQLTLGGASQIASNLTGKNVFFNVNNNAVIANTNLGKCIISTANSGLQDSSTLISLSDTSLTINQIPISGSTADEVSTSDASASAISIANAINLTQSDQNTWTSALPNQVNLGIFTPGIIAANQFSINQVSVIDPVGTEVSLIDAINLQTELTGVIASQPGGSGTAILLTATDGRNIQLKTNGSSTANFANLNLSGGSALDKTQRAGVMIRSNSEIDVGGSNPATIGLVAGSFPLSTNTGTGSIQAEVTSTITELRDTFSVVFGMGGFSFSIYNDKNPSQPVESFQNIDYTPGQNINFENFKLTLSGTPQSGDIFSISTENPVFQDVFKSIDNLVYSIKNFGKDASRLSYEIGIGLKNLDNAQVNFSKTQSQVGANLNVADSQLDIQAGFQLITREVLSQIEDLDYAQAISNLTQATFILEAAQKSFVHIQSLSLFNYLRN